MKQRAEARPPANTRSSLSQRKAARERDKARKSYDSSFNSVAATAAASNPNSSARLRDAPGSRPLDEVVLCGGSSKTPLLLRLLTSLTGITPTYIPSVSPDDAVSLGGENVRGVKRRAYVALALYA